jgi:hypothetical protein
MESRAHDSLDYGNRVKGIVKDHEMVGPRPAIEVPSSPACLRDHRKHVDEGDDFGAEIDVVATAAPMSSHVRKLRVCQRMQGMIAGAV